jgi:ABC-type molybdenum transport system ATPase subunit/photorepair protein PhrA
MRVLNIPKRHLLLYGEIGSGKKTLLRIASMVCWGYDAPIITNDTNWKL